MTRRTGGVAAGEMATAGRVDLEEEAIGFSVLPGPASAEIGPSSVCLWWLPELEVVSPVGDVAGVGRESGGGWKRLPAFAPR